MVADVCMSASVMVCTSDRFARRADGKADGLERVMMVFEDVSERNKPVANTWERNGGRCTFTQGTTDLAGQDSIPFSCTAIEQVPTVGAEDERSYGCHFGP